jgi:hypothetical protein
MTTCVDCDNISPIFFVEWEMFQTEFVDKIKAHIVPESLFHDNPAVYEIIF